MTNVHISDSNEEHSISGAIKKELYENKRSTRMLILKDAPYIKRLVAGFPPRRPGFEPGSGQVGFVVDKMALG
jgi:hypothetical protein